MNPFYKISVDQVNDNYISGWCFHRFLRSKCIHLELYCNDECLGSMKADQFREDLKALGVHFSGLCGFELVFKRKLEPGEGSLELKEYGTGRLIHEIYWEDDSSKKNFSFIQKIRSLFSFSLGKKKTILFMHIPKTAGTSFNTFVRSVNLGGPSISHIESFDPKCYPDFKNRYRYISGHLSFGTFCNYLKDNNSVIYTIMREPYSHLHSHLRWVVRSVTDNAAQTLKYRNRAIYNMRKRVAAVDFSDTSQITDFVEGITGVEAAFFDNMQTRHFLYDNVERVSGKDLQQAIQNSAEFEFIGLTENFADFIETFASRNDVYIPQNDTSTELNRSQYKPLFDVTDKTVREALLPLIVYDLQLYSHVKKTFHSLS